LKRLFKFFLNLIPRPLLIKASYWVRPIIAWWYRGDRFKDPIDGKTFKSFLPYGYENVRENVLSPSTLSLERHRLLWLYLTQETPLFKESLSLLHVAPEQCFYKRFRESSNLTYTTIDLHSPLADVKADICALPFENNSFDVVLCNHVLEHIKDDIQAMLELYRVMKPGGWGILQIPLENHRQSTYEDDSITDPKERAAIFGQYDHVRVYGMDYFDRLNEVGFEVQAIDYGKRIGPDLVEQYRLAPGELLPVVRKPIS
jgi:predicted SAM-dependent methyltransferase